MHIAKIQRAYGSPRDPKYQLAYCHRRQAETGAVFHVEKGS